MLPLRGGVREVEEWFIQAFSRINSTSLSSSPSPLSPALALTLALTIDFTPALALALALYTKPTYVTLTLTLTLACRLKPAGAGMFTAVEPRGYAERVRTPENGAQLEP